ncbi:unnamed protein product, partial [Choristocarpus tenellus]
MYTHPTPVGHKGNVMEGGASFCPFGGPGSGPSSADYDPNDPWTQRFIVHSGDGGFYIDVDAMNGLETTAGKIFVDLVCQHAARSQAIEEAGGILLPALGAPHHAPPAFKAPPPMAQYEPFRNTFVRDPRCIPRLLYANVTDSGTQHFMREAAAHWKMRGNTWSRVPRFRKGESAFTHDPTSKPSQAVVDRWYHTESGSKASLAGRVEASRWQTCHSFQSGREKSPTRRGVKKNTQPGPGYYSFSDPWEVKTVCGQIPRSPMFCNPVSRPNTITNTLANSNSVASVRKSTRGHVSALPVSEEASAMLSSQRSPSEDSHQSSTPMPIPALPLGFTPGSTYTNSRADIASVSSLTMGSIQAQNLSQRLRGQSLIRVPKKKKHQWPARQRHGPISFTRARRPTASEDSLSREEAYGRRFVRLPTSTGDVITSIAGRRSSSWGEDLGSAGGVRRAEEGVNGAQIFAEGGGMKERRGAGSGAKARARTAGPKVVYGAPTVRAQTSAGVPGIVGTGARLEEADKARRQEAALLAVPPIYPFYREPGESELPVLFCGHTAPLVSRTSTKANGVVDGGRGNRGGQGSWGKGERKAGGDGPGTGNIPSNWQAGGEGFVGAGHVGGTPIPPSILS